MPIHFSWNKSLIQSGHPSLSCDPQIGRLMIRLHCTKFSRSREFPQFSFSFFLSLVHDNDIVTATTRCFCQSPPDSRRCLVKYEPTAQAYIYTTGLVISIRRPRSNLWFVWGELIGISPGQGESKRILHWFYLAHPVQDLHNSQTFSPWH